MRRPRLLLALALGAYLLTGLAQVRPEERAVVRRFGQVVARPHPGLWVGLPWGIDRVDRVPVRTARQVKAGATSEAPDAGQFLTGDQNLVNVSLVVDYAISETDQDLDDYVIHQDRVDAELAREAEAAAAEWAAGRGVDEALLTGSAELPAWVMARLPGRVDRLRLGVRVQRVSVAGLAPPDEVRVDFERVTQAQTGIRTKEFQARQEAEQRRRQADALKYKFEQEALVFRDGQVRQARADADDFLAQLAAYRTLKARDPDALSVIWWAEMTKALAGVRARGGRVEPLDAYLGKDGLDLTQFLTPRKR
ncbi:SPFH domain-containing protein [Urbifossiella limnaea]|uniref:Modulator of FtsH protease HflK n=1 Tax=Urbifossiella limnaea TaxID=2528023 RepID=A0A517XM28_9BACT|nr:SPFH domain-containing protein [Urbifossiella limnaea]QDU18560.1 Modulator of FtsH protease HflK [Urbifossiella limnaea]